MISVLEEFALASGLQVNPLKSTMWFSWKCEDDRKHQIFLVFGAKEAEVNEKYLGIVVSQSTRQYDATHEMLMSKLYSKLAGWKINMLSFADRVALLKSVLASIPVYYMTVAALTSCTISKINRLFRQFVWGKLGEDRYISFVAWAKLCEGTDKGGLGIKDTKMFNNALLLKVVWQLAANEDLIWVKVFRAKYFPRAGFWDIKNTRDSSVLWRTVQNLKEFFKDQIRWRIGDGRQIEALNQPWFEGWSTQTIRTNEQMDLKVANLFDSETESWKESEIERLFGSLSLQTIMASANKPKLQPLVPDKLIWMASKRGKYTTKEGYDNLVL